MNQYGTLAMRHWREWRPDAFNQLPDPETFFTELGERVEEMIAEETTQRQSREKLSSDYLTAVGQLNTVRHEVEQTILSEMVYVTPEPEMEDPDEPEVKTATGMPVDPEHPLWAMQRDENVSAEEYLAAYRAWRVTLPPRSR